MPFSYNVYGLQLVSNQPILRLNDSPASSRTDVQVFLGELPLWFSESFREREEIFYCSSNRTENDNPAATFLKSTTGSYLRILYGDGTNFVVDRAGTRVWATWLENLTLEDAVVYLLGPVMGFLLRLRGLISLHASAIAVDNRAVAIVGGAGAGKSTTAALFARLGYPVVSDDIVPLLDRGEFFAVQSGYPCVCLWPESVESLYGSSDSLPLLTPTWDKRYLPLGNKKYHFHREPLPLAAIYLLGHRDREQGRPFAEPVSGALALMALTANTYMNYLSDSDARGREFEFLGRLAKAVPVRRVHPHSDPRQLGRLCEVIVEDCRSLNSSGGGGGAGLQHRYG